MRVLIVEDDVIAAEQLARDLREGGHEPVHAADGESAVVLASSLQLDAVLLDVMLPDIDGMTVASAMRERKVDAPILMLSALGALDDRLAGLGAGADDYLVKPAALLEIEARIKAISRRIGRGARRADGRAVLPATSSILRAGDIEVDETRHQATRAGRKLRLQKLEFRLLCELIRNEGSILTRQMLYQSIWNYEFAPRTNIVESHMRRLRAELNGPGESDPITTLRGVGYRFIAED